MRYDLQVLGCTRYRSGCPISLRDIVLISLAAETSRSALISGEKRHAVSFHTFVLDSTKGRQAASKQEDKPSRYQDTKTSFRSGSLTSAAMGRLEA